MMGWYGGGVGTGMWLFMGLFWLALLVLIVQVHSSAVSTLSCQRNVLTTGPLICTHAASRRETSSDAICSASFRLPVVVVIWIYSLIGI